MQNRGWTTCQSGTMLSTDPQYVGAAFAADDEVPDLCDRLGRTCCVRLVFDFLARLKTKTTTETLHIHNNGHCDILLALGSKFICRLSKEKEPPELCQLSTLASMTSTSLRWQKVTQTSTISQCDHWYFCLPFGSCLNRINCQTTDTMNTDLNHDQIYSYNTKP